MKFCNFAGAHKTRRMPHPMVDKFNDMVIHIDTLSAFYRQTDRQTDGLTELVVRYHSLHAVHADTL